MELVDVVDSKSTASDSVPVRVRPPAPNKNNPNLLPIGETFGFSLFFDYPNYNKKINKTEVKENDKHKRNSKLE